jgi:pilus assembly protein Flp/PilA
MLTTLRTHLKREEGATAVEYGIMVALIAVVIIAAVWAIGNSLNENFQDVADCLEADAEDCDPNA